MADPKKKRRWNRVFHRWSGIVLLIPIVIASVTGVVLNHTVDLDLSNHHINARWVQSRYGMILNGEPVAYGHAAKAYAAEWDGKVFFGKKLIETNSPLIGAVPLRDGISVVTKNEVHYFGLDGELIEKLDSVTLPEGEISRAGRTQELALVLDAGGSIWISDRELIEFTQATESENISWSGVVSPTKANRQTWETAYSGKGIPLDRLILDIHSGRFFGGIGKWIYDIMVFGVLVLSVSGLILFFRTRKRSA
jgi:hypothetical protein